MENQNRKYIIIGVILVVVLFIIILVMTVVNLLLQRNQGSAVQTQVSPQPQISEFPLDANGDPNEAIEQYLAPTLLTPAQAPYTLNQLKEMLQMPMDYGSVTIRYSTGRDMYIVYYDTNLLDAEKDLLSLLGQYGINDINSVNIEYISNQQPLNGLY